MASKDRSKTGSQGDPKTRGGNVADKGTKKKALSPERRIETAGPATGKRSPTPQPSAAKEIHPPKPGTEVSDAERQPVPPGIDAMAILEHAEAEERAARLAKGHGDKSDVHVSAAEAIAKAVVRDHQDVGVTKPHAESAAPKAPDKPRKPTLKNRLKPKLPVPTEPDAPIGGLGAEGLPPPVVDSEAVEALLNAELADTFGFLGMHPASDGRATVVRVFQPDAQQVQVVDATSAQVLAQLDKAHDEGLFVGRITDDMKGAGYRLRVTSADGVEMIDDPYRFPALISQQDIALLSKGEHLKSYEVLGAHRTEILGVAGTSFAVWAPNAHRVAVVGDFNGWDGRRHGMRLHRQCGVWEIFIPAVSEGSFYKFEIKSNQGESPQTKSDPYAFAVEQGPGAASVVSDIDAFRWRDTAWLKGRQQRPSDTAPLSFYEVHLGSWRRNPEEEDRWLTYRELADELVNYVSDLGFTHIALLPVGEHSYDDTLGYLPSALFAPTGRYGTPEDFCFFVDACHRAGLGVVVDWVPNFFSEELQGLGRFDGTALYEHPDGHVGRDPDWHLPMYDLGRAEVANYLLSNALYWFDRFHLDGLRIDSLAKLLYRDYGRAAGEWTVNQEGGNDNLEALAFVRRLNELVGKDYPGVLMIAEDSSLRGRLTAPVSEDGLGFTYRWNSAWCYDTLRYLGRHPVHRKYYQYELTNPLTYAFDERFIFPISHDHVSIGQGSMLSKVPGDHWQKFAILRAWYGLMYGLPGKKLFFMGTEFAQDRQWNSDISLDWHLMEDNAHAGMQRLIRDLNAVYSKSAALHELDNAAEGFEWIDFSDEDDSVIVFIRYSKGRKRHVVVVSHFTPVVRTDYQIGVPQAGRYKEILNTDAEAYGGGNAGNAGGVTTDQEPSHGRECSVRLTLPPYATIVLEAQEQ